MSGAAEALDNQLFVVRPGHEKDALFICEAKGYARIARLWNGRTERDEYASLLAASPFMRRALKEVLATVTPKNDRERDALRIAKIAVETSYAPQRGVKR